MLHRETLDPDTLARAIAVTFIRRGMAVPAVTPIRLTDEFTTDATRQALWQAFMKKNDLKVEPLMHVVTSLRTQLQPIFNLVSLKTSMGKQDTP